jgi:hypothetical protein
MATFPFASAELSLLAVHPRLVGLAQALLKTDDVRLYSAEAWAKFTGAVNYEQEHHRDFLHPRRLHNVEMFVFLNDVSEDLGPTHLVSTTITAEVPLMHGSFSQSEFPTLYDQERSSAGPAGTVILYRGETVHRATNVTAPTGARYSLHCGFRPAHDEWIGYRRFGALYGVPSWNERRLSN